MARYDGPPDSYWDPPDDPPECGCEGEGRAADCDGCDDCVVDVTTTRYVVARRARPGILVGDQARRTDGFSYQRGGGPRLGYIHQAVRQGYGPGHHPALHGYGWRGSYPHTLPPEAVERRDLTARTVAVQSVEQASWSATDAATLRDALTAAVALRADVEAYLSRLPDDVARVLRHPMTVILDRATRTLPQAVARLEEAQARREAERVRLARIAAWRASGASWQPKGAVVTWEGREYVVGDDWTRLVVHSDLEVGGELVDCSAVGVLDLHDPTTGRLALRWDRRYDLPAPV